MSRPAPSAIRSWIIAVPRPAERVGAREIAPSRPEITGMDMPDRFDVVVAGAGHNSLIAAAYLAKAGYRCLVLEGRPLLGGGVKTAELTLKGFKDDVCSTAHTFLLDNPMMKNDELRLR